MSHITLEVSSGELLELEITEVFVILRGGGNPHHDVTVRKCPVTVLGSRKISEGTGSLRLADRISLLLEEAEHVIHYGGVIDWLVFPHFRLFQFLLVQFGFLFLPPLLFILLPLEVLNSVLEVLLRHLLRLLLPVLPLQLPLLLLLQLEGLRLGSVLDPHLPILSHGYQPPDVGLNLDNGPQFLLIDPDKE